MSPRPVVAAAIVDSLTKPTLLLAAERSYPPELAGLFELPGGKVEQGEDPRDALEREIAEELGTALAVGMPVPGPPVSNTPVEANNESDAEADNETDDDDQSAPGFAPWPILNGRVMWVWLAEVAPGAPVPTTTGAHRCLRWIPLADAHDVPWIPTNLPIVENTLTRIADSTM